MSDRLDGRRRILAFLCCAAYFASYMTRINYAAVRLAIADELILTHPERLAELGLAISAVSVSYGFGQFLSGLLGDRVPPVFLVCAGLCGAMICNLLIPVFYPSVYMMAVAWGINGFFQSLIRPPLGRIIAANFDEKEYIDTCVGVSNSSQAATILTYLLIPVCLRIFNNDWRPAFYFPVVITFVTMGCWILLVPKIIAPATAPAKADGECVSQGGQEKRESLTQLFLRSGLLIFVPAVLIHGFLRDGITAWMPDFISEVGGLDTGISILTTAILPMFCIVSVTAAKKICYAVPSDGKVSAMLFGICAAASVIIVILMDVPNAVSFFVIVILMALITGCMHAANHIFITRIPGAFKRAGRVSSIVGILNAITYIGSALSPYAIYLLAGRGGWNKAVLLWSALAAFSAFLCAAACGRWNDFKKKQK